MKIYGQILTRITSSFYYLDYRGLGIYFCMKTMNKHIIAFRENKILVENPGNNEKDPLLLISFLGQLGVALSPRVKGIITPETEKEILDALTPWAVETYGLGVRWLTVYDNPEHLIAKTPEELLVDQISLYLEPELIESIKERDGEENFWVTNNFEITRVLEPISYDGFMEISKNLMGSKTPLGPERLEVLEWFLDNPEYIKIPENIPVKETLCRVLDTGEYSVNSPTDILRYLSWVDSGDPRYPEKFKPTSIPNRSRKIANRLLSDLTLRRNPWSLAGEMNRYRSAWVGMAKTCHPSEKRVLDLLGILFGKDKHWKSEYWGNQVRKAYDQKNYREVLNLYLQRPGELVRHFDSLYRRFLSEAPELSELMLKRALSDNRISGKMLISLSYYYDKRNLVRNWRSYLGKNGERV